MARPSFPPPPWRCQTSIAARPVTSAVAALPRTVHVLRIVAGGLCYALRAVRSTTRLSMRRVTAKEGKPTRVAGNRSSPHAFAQWDASRPETAVEWPLAWPMSVQHKDEVRFNNVAQTLEPFREG
jgi:hypothetical protein